MSDYIFERLSDKNLKDLIFLYSKAFNEKTNLAFLRKKYSTEKFGLSFTGYLAYHTASKEPASYYGVFPITVCYQNQTYLAAQSGDTMTHPNHRGKGLFITLAGKTYDLAKQNGVEFVFGFPNQNSYPGFVKKLHWIHYANVNNYKINTGSVPLEKVAKKFKIFNYFYQKLFLNRINSFSNLHPFPNSLHEQNPDFGFVIHDDFFLNYKSYYKSFIVEIEGIKCWFKVDGRLWVGDIEYCDREKFYAVIKGLISFSKKIFCSSIHFSTFENTKYDSWLKEKYIQTSQNAVGCLNLGDKVNAEKFAYQALDFDTF